MPPARCTHLQHQGLINAPRETHQGPSAWHKLLGEVSVFNAGPLLLFSAPSGSHVHIWCYIYVDDKFRSSAPAPSPPVQCQVGLSCGVRGVVCCAVRILHGGEVACPLDLHEAHLLCLVQRVEDEGLQLDALHTTGRQWAAAGMCGRLMNKLWVLNLGFRA